MARYCLCIEFKEGLKWTAMTAVKTPENTEGRIAAILEKYSAPLEVSPALATLQRMSRDKAEGKEGVALGYHKAWDMAAEMEALLDRKTNEAVIKAIQNCYPYGPIRIIWYTMEETKAPEPVPLTASFSANVLIENGRIHVKTYRGVTVLEETEKTLEPDENPVRAILACLEGILPGTLASFERKNKENP